MATVQAAVTDAPHVAQHVDDRTNGVRSPLITEVTIWIARTSGTAHWRTSYSFDPSTSQGCKGMVIDMYQPTHHVQQTPNEIASNAFNNYGTMILSVSSDKILTTRPAFTQIVRFQVALRVQDLLNLIYANNLQYYMFDSSKCSGCLYWQLTLLGRLEAMGWIPSQTTATIKGNIAAWRNVTRGNADMVPWPPVQGTFYRPTQTPA